MPYLPYHIIQPTIEPVPILVSVPHSAVFIPPHLVNQYRPEVLEHMEDTDFFIDRLYEFAPQLGITLIVADINRWVIDLNRDPNNNHLYNDGRIITSLVPETDFNGQPLYKDDPGYPSTKEIEQRRHSYFNPYHQKIESLLKEFKNNFGKAVLWDAHSIKRKVPTIQQDPFPDFIIGTNDGRSSEPALVNTIFQSLSSENNSIEMNHPFKGGFITRSFGAPKNNIHAIQLEMSKDCYMSDGERHYDFERAKKVQTLLKSTLRQLITQLDRV